MKREELVERWLPANVCAPTTFIAKYQTKTGLWVLYPEKSYSVPPKFYIVIDPRALEIKEETTISTSPAFSKDMEKRTKGLFQVVEIDSRGVVWSKAYRAKIKPGVYVIKISPKRGNIHVLIPNRPSKPKINVYILGIYGKSTGMGGLAGGLPLNAVTLYSSANTSNSGRHWITWVVYATESGEPLRLLKFRHSNAGNWREEMIIIHPDCKVEEKDRYEVIESRETNCGWVKVKKIKDNAKDEVFTQLVLEYHQARKTGAKITHEIEPKDAVEFIYSSRHILKTHWEEVYKIKKQVKIKTIRITNSGNVKECEEVVEP